MTLDSPRPHSPERRILSNDFELHDHSLLRRNPPDDECPVAVALRPEAQTYRYGITHGRVGGDPLSFGRKRSRIRVCFW